MTSHMSSKSFRPLSSTEYTLTPSSWC
jgi:hypothetical protein